MYMDGLGVAKNYQEAHHWFILASKKGHPLANHALGLIYEKGLGVKSDPDQANLYFLLAKENNYKNNEVRRILN
jgi:TPR repeat protein